MAPLRGFVRVRERRPADVLKKRARRSAVALTARLP
jgi:hypothetical protein